jgi:thiamine-monophosphate kinase
MDLSDGLSSDLRRLCEASQVAAMIELVKLPLHPLAQAREDGLRLALDGGEDYELLFAARPGVKMPRQIAGVAITRIGELVKLSKQRELVMQVGLDGRVSALAAGGWEHRFG